MNLALRSLFILCLVFTSVSSSSVLAQAELSKSLVQQLNTTRQEIPVYVMLQTQTNAKAILSNTDARGLSKKQRIAAALSQVKSANLQAQRPLIQKLETLEGVSNVRGHWIVNLVGFNASPEKIREIATYPEVAAIYYDQPWEVERALDEEIAFSAPGDKEPGLSAVNADKMWALGYTGFGGIAFTADTGVDPYHPAINHKYAGYDGRVGSWYDFTENTDFPFDCGDHGTHVTGTILGVDRITEDTIGVAYNAHWLGGAILCGVGTADNIGAFEWAIDPDGDFDTDEDRPVVINNSWRDPSIADEECTSTNPYPVILDNLEAAGIAVVFSAGNSGPDPSTITPPHNYNAGLVNAFTVGALNQGSTGIAGFSSRGPALCSMDSIPLDIKPEVSAPGQSVRSCLPGTEYGLKSGTSMAAPHVAGAILLLSEAFPDLDGETLKLALYYSARDLGEAGEDNTFGRGIIDVFAAYNYLIAEGNTPTAPSWPSIAPMVKGLVAAESACNGEFTLQLTLSNDGAEDLNSISFEYAMDGVTTPQSIDGLDIMPGETQVLTISGTSSLSGSQILHFRLVTANGQAVDPRLDIGGSLEISLSQIAPASLVVDDFGTEGPCLNSPIVLSMVGTTGDSIFPYFNESPSFGVGGIDDEQPFIIEELTEVVSLYGIAEYLIVDGIETPDLSEVDFISTDDVEMDIFANADVRFRRANILSSGSGRIVVEIIDSDSGQRVGRRSNRIEEGLNSIDIRANLEQGKAYMVTISGNIDLGILPNDRIRGTSLGDDRIDVINAAGSFFLFDIETGYTDGCPAIEVEFSPDPSRTSPTLAPMAIPAEVELGSQVTFSETSVATATNHRWIIEGTTYTGAGDMISVPTTSIGTLSARVLAEADNGCLATGTVDAEVIQGSSSTEDVDESLTLDLFPNPAAQYFELTRVLPNLANVSLIDATGRTVKQWNGSSTRFDLDEVARGAYLVKLVDQEGASQSLPLIVD